MEGGISPIKNRILNKNKCKKQNYKLQTILLLTQRRKGVVLKIVPIRLLRY